jgi:serine/threonine-protein kinase RsbW
MADSLVDYMRIEDVPKDIINDMNLVFQELFANAYQHGNKEDDSKRIEAGVCVGKGEVSLYVEDEGEGFDPSKVDFLLDPDKMYGERGRGLYLVKGLADEIEFNDKGNRVTVRKKINLTGGIH